MSNVHQLRNTGGFTRMDNDLYEALIGAELSGRELRVALAIHRLTAGFNRDAVKIAALYIAKMMYGDETKAEAERANVSRAINSLIRQRVLFRDGGSRDPITFLPPSEWKIDAKSTVLKSTHCVENTPSSVLKITHIKDRNTKTTANAVVAALAATSFVETAKSEQPDDLIADQPKTDTKADRVPYSRILEIYNRVCASHLPQCLKLTEKRKSQIRKCWNLEVAGNKPFRTADFWEGYFNDCLTNPHWIGQNDRGWKADIEFLTKEANVLRVLEAG